MSEYEYTEKDLRTAYEDGCKFFSFNDLKKCLKKEHIKMFNSIELLKEVIEHFENERNEAEDLGRLPLKEDLQIKIEKFILK